MNKAERLEYIKRKMATIDPFSDAIIPPNKRDVHEEMDMMDSYNEYQRSKRTSKKSLTSDER
jgi:hypothetical protein